MQAHLARIQVNTSSTSPGTHSFDGIVIIKARPGSPATKIVKVVDGVLHIDVAAPPEDNKANIELLKFLRRLSKKDVRLVSGTTSRNKVVEFIRKE